MVLPYLDIGCPSHNRDGSLVPSAHPQQQLSSPVYRDTTVNSRYLESQGGVKDFITRCSCFKNTFILAFPSRTTTDRPYAPSERCLARCASNKTKDGRAYDKVKGVCIKKNMCTCNNTPTDIQPSSSSFLVKPYVRTCSSLQPCLIPPPPPPPQNTRQSSPLAHSSSNSLRRGP